MNTALRTSYRLLKSPVRVNKYGGVPQRTLMTIESVQVCSNCVHFIIMSPYSIFAQYTAHATASGKGRDGQVTSDDDDGIQLRLAKPKSLGGKGDGQNPEQLFAMGYAGESRIVFICRQSIFSAHAE